MPDRITLVLDLTAEEHHRLETLAHQRGYDEPGDYLRALVESDVLAQTEALDFATNGQPN